MRRSFIALTALILSAIGVPAGADGIVLSLNGLPSYQVFRGFSGSSAADIENPRAVTAANQHTETRLRPGTDCGEPEIQVHAFNDDTYILRQSLCTNFEGPPSEPILRAFSAWSISSRTSRSRGCWERTSR